MEEKRNIETKLHKMENDNMGVYNSSTHNKRLAEKSEAQKGSVEGKLKKQELKSDANNRRKIQYCIS